MSLGSPKETLTHLKQQLQNTPRDVMNVQGFRAAAVLVPLVERHGELALLLTVRAAKLTHHANQIAFPGGRAEPGEGLEAAALREAFEEVGLKSSGTEILGRLDDHPSPAQYIVTPVVARVQSQPWQLNPDEVDEAFYVPLTALANSNPWAEERRTAHFARRLYFYPYQDRIIWGLTGNIIRNLLELIQGDLGRDWIVSPSQPPQ